MGNCLVFNPPTPGSARNNYNTAKIYATTSQFSTAASEAAYEEENRCGQILEKVNLREFSFADLKSATEDFKSDYLLGEGEFGKVYKGWIDEKTFAPSKSGIGMAVAIKKLKAESLQGLQEWQSDINFLRRVSHLNLVKLLGYCLEDEEFLLVYEFMQKGSLENHLFTRDAGLSCEIRLKIVIGAARGLAFLHNSNKKAMYRLLKPSNILLDSNYNVKISDFGLARLGPFGWDCQVTTRFTDGYADPEYIATGHLYPKSDVYGFGLVLLEVLTGLRALDMRRTDEQQHLLGWVKPILLNEEKLKIVMDTQIDGQYSSKAMMLTAKLCLKCLRSNPRNRPSMKEVVKALEQIEAI